VAPETSGITVEKYGKGPSPGTTSTPEQRSLDGATAETQHIERITRTITDRQQHQRTRLAGRRVNGKGLLAEETWTEILPGITAR
jgi:hypothetical protein